MAKSFDPNIRKSIDSMVQKARGFGNDTFSSHRKVLSKSNFGGKETTLSESSWLSKEFTNFGYMPDCGKVPDEYLIRIKSIRMASSVVGIVQKGISISSESVWENFMPTMYSDVADSLVQAVSGGKWSLVTKASSRRKWKGSTPLSISIPLKFEAIEDAYSNVVQPCRILQSLVLPSEGNTSAISKAYKTTQLVLSPPGPTPFTMEGVFGNRTNYRDMTGEELTSNMTGGDFIVVEYGKFLSFFNVIMRKALVEYASQFDKNGNPISATVNLTFETYEMITAEVLQDFYREEEIKK